MRKLAFLPLLTLALACADTPIVDPDPVASPELAAAQKQGGQGQVVRMVPLTMKGTWAYGTTGNTDPCGDYPGSTPAFIEYGGTSTHMGRIMGRATNCMDYSALPAVGIKSQTTWVTAANGDEVWGQGTVDLDPSIDLVFEPGEWFVIGPVLINGGTGRFENATGWYMLYGDYSMGTGGNYRSVGMISSVGSSK